MLINILHIISGLIGFIITAILIHNHKSNPVMNIYMLLLIFIISFRFFSFGIINILTDQIVLNLYLKYSNLTALVIPICYLYFKNVVTNTKQLYKNEWIHFIFPICYFLITLQIYNHLIPSYTLKISLFLIFSAYLLHYIYLSYAILKKNVWHKKSENITIYKQRKQIYNWTLFLFIALALASTRLIVSLFIEIYQNETIRGLSYQWVSSIIWIAILIKILVTPEILYGYQLLNEKLKENRNSNLTYSEIWKSHATIEINNVQHLALKDKINDNLVKYFEEIERISIGHDFFRDPKLTLSNIATELKIPKSHLSYLFKYHTTISFSEYKKVIRIQDAINLIDEGYLNNNTLDSLSKKVGFTSYNPFFTGFKEIIGISPLEYINKTHSLV